MFYTFYSFYISIKIELINNLDLDYIIIRNKEFAFDENICKNKLKRQN